MPLLQTGLEEREMLHGMSLAALKKWLDRIGRRYNIDSDAVRGIYSVEDVKIDAIDVSQSIVLLKEKGKKIPILLCDLEEGANFSEVS